MKTRLLLIALAVFLAAAMVGGTMAWFTAKAEADDAAFTAGTVMIEAGSSMISSQYFDPESAWYLYGVQYETGDLYEIDVLGGTATKFYELDLASLGPTDGFSPNGLAFDNPNRRLYFSIIKGSSSDLYFYDLKEQKLVKAGNLPGVNYGATYGRGFYWYMPNGTDDLYKVTFYVDGKIASFEKISNISGGKKFNFGDIVIDIRDGIIYGSTSLSGVDKMFFTYDIFTAEFNEIVDDTVANGAVNLQLAFGSDGELYGHHTWDQKFYQINPQTGLIDQEIAVTPNLSFNDLASGYVSTWNPGDCSNVRFTVHNTGSKDIRVRATAVKSEWEFNWEWIWENWDALCFTELGFETLNEAYAIETTYEDIQIQSEWLEFVAYVEGLDDPVEITLCDESSGNWTLENGYWYYTGEPIANGNEVELCLKVCLSGPLATNEFQGGRYKLSARFEAVQSSNYAPYYEWGTILYGAP